MVLAAGWGHPVDSRSWWAYIGLGSGDGPGYIAEGGADGYRATVRLKPPVALP